MASAEHPPPLFCEKCSSCFVAPLEWGIAHVLENAKRDLGAFFRLICDSSGGGVGQAKRTWPH